MRWDGYNLALEVRNYRFTPENVGAVAVANEGHAHLYINGQKIARLYSPWRHLPRSLFHDGPNRLQVELNANDHSIWGVAGEPIGADVLVDTRVEDGDPIVRRAGALHARLELGQGGKVTQKAAGRSSTILATRCTSLPASW